MTEPKTVDAGIKRFQHILGNALKCIEIGELEAAEEQLMRARALEPARPELYDVWSRLERARGRFEEAARRLRTAWDLEPTAERGLKLSEELSPDARLERLRDLWRDFPSDPGVVVALTRAELAQGGFDAGDRASRVLVDCPGGSAALMDALASAIEGLGGDTESMDVFTPLVSAEITRRTALEATGELPGLEDLEETVDQESLETASPAAPPPVENPPSELGEATIDQPAPSHFGSDGREIEEERWKSQRRERLEKMKRAQKSRAKAEEPWKRTTWKTQLSTYAPLVALVPALLAAAWVAFLGGHEMLIRRELDGLLMYATMPTLAALSGAGVGSLLDRQAGMSALVVAPVLGIAASSVAIVAYERAVEDALISASADPVVLFAACAVTWGFAALAGLRGTS